MVTKLTAQKKLVDMTPTWYTTFQVIKGPLGGGKRRNGGGGAGGTCFSGGTEGDQSSPKGCLGGGRLYQTDCKLTVNKGGIARVLQSLLGESGKSYSDTTKIVRSTPPPPRDDKV